MIETTCNINLNSVDFLEIKCNNCNSFLRVNLQKEQRVTTCPVCNEDFDEVSIKAAANLMMTISTLKNFNKDTISLIKVEK